MSDPKTSWTDRVLNHAPDSHDELVAAYKAGIKRQAVSSDTSDFAEWAMNQQSLSPMQVRAFIERELKVKIEPPAQKRTGPRFRKGDRVQIKADKHKDNSSIATYKEFDGKVGTVTGSEGDDVLVKLDSGPRDPVRFANGMKPRGVGIYKYVPPQVVKNVPKVELIYIAGKPPKAEQVVVVEVYLSRGRSEKRSANYYTGYVTGANEAKGGGWYFRMPPQQRGGEGEAGFQWRSFNPALGEVKYIGIMGKRPSDWKKELDALRTLMQEEDEPQAVAGGKSAGWSYALRDGWFSLVGNAPFNRDHIKWINSVLVPAKDVDTGEVRERVPLKFLRQEYSGPLTYAQEQQGLVRETIIHVQFPEGSWEETNAKLQKLFKGMWEVQPLARPRKPQTQQGPPPRRKQRKRFPFRGADSDLLSAAVKLANDNPGQLQEALLPVLEKHAVGRREVTHLLKQDVGRVEKGTHLHEVSPGTYMAMSGRNRGNVFDAPMSMVEPVSTKMSPREINAINTAIERAMRNQYWRKPGSGWAEVFDILNRAGFEPTTIFQATSPRSSQVIDLARKNPYDSMSPLEVENGYLYVYWAQAGDRGRYEFGGYVTK